MKAPSRWLLAVAYLACAVLLFQHLAKLSIHYRQSPTQFRDSRYYLFWGLLFLPWVCAVAAVLFTRARRSALRVVVVCLLVLVAYQAGWVLKALAPVEELSYRYYVGEAPLPGTEDPPVQLPYQYDVTLVIPLYALGVSGLWAVVVVCCFIAGPLRRTVLRLDASLARDFRDPAP